MQIDVYSMVHGQAQQSATISWSSGARFTARPDKWQVSVSNFTQTQNDFWYHQWIYDVDVGESIAFYRIHTRQIEHQE